MITAIIRFHAQPGRGDELAAWLMANQPGLRAFPGFRHIALLRDPADPDRLVEIERWDRADDHRAMVEAVAARGGWDALELLLRAEPDTAYLEELASLTR